jgi:pimeloyl-ACP methyl ester carboxylesterase
MTGAPRIERVQLNGADIEYDVRGSGEPVVFIHGAILSDGFVPVIEQTGIAENFQIVHYRRRGYAGSSRALAGMTMQGWAGDCIALLNHLGIASAHVAGHSFGAGIALQMAIDAPGRVRKLALLEPPLGSLVPSGEQFTEWVASVREIYDSGDKTAATDIVLAGAYGQDYRRFTDGAPCGCVRPRGIRYRHVLSGRTRSHATLEYLNRRPERYSTPGAVDARQRYIAGIL